MIHKNRKLGILIILWVIIAFFIQFYVPVWLGLYGGLDGLTEMQDFFQTKFMILKVLNVIVWLTLVGILVKLFLIRNINKYDMNSKKIILNISICLVILGLLLGFFDLNQYGIFIVLLAGFLLVIFNLK